nr:MAG: hypothetical protein DIU52_05305 [bacterium]
MSPARGGSGGATLGPTATRAGSSGHANTPTRQHANTPTRQHANTPTRLHAYTPTRLHVPARPRASPRVPAPAPPAARAPPVAPPQHRVNAHRPRLTAPPPRQTTDVVARARRRSGRLPRPAR